MVNFIVVFLNSKDFVRFVKEKKKISFFKIKLLNSMIRNFSNFDNFKINFQFIFKNLKIPLDS